MTRWARVGNSQKHKKIPEDATPWEEFWPNRNQNSTSDGNRNKVKSGRIEKKKQKKFGFNEKRNGFENPENKVSKFRNAEQQESESNHTSPKKKLDEGQLSSESPVMSRKQQRKAKKREKLQQLKNTESVNSQDADNSNVSDSMEVSRIDEDHLNTEFQGLSKKQLKMAKKKEKLQRLKNTESVDSQDPDTLNVSDNMEVSRIDKDHSEFQGLSKKQLKMAKKKEKLQQLKNTENTASVDIQDADTSNVSDSMEVSQAESKSPKEKDFQGKKKLFMKKLEKKRKENGITLLPAKVERKLYIIKKRLREKGLPPAAIKDIARKERRKEELKFRSSVTTKPCFNCRQIGHLLADCPKKQETGLCFKCGSADHTSYKCPNKIEGYPLAKCFVCKEQGHISKDCPQNKHGIYIKGGKCGLCGNVNHLKKDCPTLKKKNDEETDITAYTISEEKSVDAEIIPVEHVKPNMKTSMKKGKKAKLVKF